MERAIKEVCQRVVGTEVSNKAKRNIEEGFLMPWKRLKTFEFERGGTPEKISDYWEEQREWVRGLEDGKFPEYARRLKHHRAIEWSRNYFGNNPPIQP